MSLTCDESGLSRDVFSSFLSLFLLMCPMPAYFYKKELILFWIEVRTAKVTGISRHTIDNAGRFSSLAFDVGRQKTHRQDQKSRQQSHPFMTMPEPTDRTRLGA